MALDPAITVYRSRPGGGAVFTRGECRGLSRVYASFEDLRTLSANEALLGVLASATEHDMASAVYGETVFLFVKGKFPATSMTVPGLSPVVIPTADESGTELERELGKRRIAYTPVFFQGYFMRADGKTFHPREDIVIPYAASTVRALAEFDGSDFESCSAFFGKQVVKLVSNGLATA